MGVISGRHLLRMLRLGKIRGDMPEIIFPHIATIYDTPPHVGGAQAEHLPNGLYVERKGGWTVRLASRCVVANGSRIALQRLDTEGVIKVPGGGFHHGEDAKLAVGRELEEEVGLAVSALRPLKPLGVVVEFRKEWELVMLSYCYQAEMKDGAKASKPTEAGSHLVWADSPNAALAMMQTDNPDTYDARFMQTRDTAVLEFYRDNVII